MCVCVCVCIIAVKMTHLSTATCQDVTSFDGVQTVCVLHVSYVFVCICVCIVYVCALLLCIIAVKMTHLLTATCQDVTSFDGVQTVYVCACHVCVPCLCVSALLLSR